MWGLAFFLTIFCKPLSKQFLIFSPFEMNFVAERKVLSICSSNSKLTKWIRKQLNENSDPYSLLLQIAEENPPIS